MKKTIAVLAMMFVAGMAAGQTSTQNHQSRYDYGKANPSCTSEPDPICISYVQLILTPEQAKYPGNEWVKPCGDDNHDDACVKLDPMAATQIKNLDEPFVGGKLLVANPVVMSGFTSPRVSISSYGGGVWKPQTTVSMRSSTGRIDMLSDDEWSELQKRRKAVADYEEQIARAHGVDFGQTYIPPTCLYSDMGSCLANDVSAGKDARPADHFEFRGQFLLINVPN